ncbi:hypothetical protein [Streptomyces sp. NBC_01257]|uniref:hypothetical protein n=1 Tax=Streptomyces sp. NBC_01257 TaxID=2903799 RepID=UPI002DD7F28C|nr:hypothetical protein [Streptomyces sp. NBC_01257]WRZ69483.1 hypothetical protein OG408_38730 [Streptomyces sp. NBC_01257]
MDVILAVVDPWLDEHADVVREALAPLATFGGWARTTYEFGDPLETAYALSRVNDALIYTFQPPLPADAETPWAHDIHHPERWPPVTPDQYLAAFARLGMAPIGDVAYEPFFHEVVHVAESEAPGAPVEITGTVWPGLMLGEMLFSRTGVTVRAGAQHLVAGVADRSPLFDVFMRRYRETSDESMGWGSNSQWRTDFRRDYVTDDAFHFDVDEEFDSSRDQFGEPRKLTPAERSDLVRHRCLTRPLQDPDAWETACPGGRLTVRRA